MLAAFCACGDTEYSFEYPVNSLALRDVEREEEREEDEEGEKGVWEEEEEEVMEREEEVVEVEGALK